MTRGLGHRPDFADDVADDLVERHVGRLLGAPRAAAPASLDFSYLMPAIPDQGATSSCVGQAFATSIFLRAKMSGFDIPRPSPKGIYDLARLVDVPRGELTDIGSRPRAAILGLQEHGMVAEERWPLTAENVNVTPPLDVFQEGLGALLTGWYRIGSGQGASILIQQAILKGFFPVFAMPVDEAYMFLSSARIYEGRRGVSLGGHMQAICGFGDGHAKVLTSWGANHGNRGVVSIANDYIDSGECTDILVPTVVPSVVH